LGSVGPPLPNLTLRFVGADGKDVPTGKEGEMWVKGPTVFKGYLNNPSATSEALTSDGYFKTGDIGFEDEDGNLYITDRIKELIKYKGSQVAPAELEGILITHPSVEDTAVIGFYVESMATELPMAYVVPKKGVKRDEATAMELIDWLAKRTAKSKRLRGGIVWTDEIPKSASGKILRRLVKDKAKESGGKDAMGAMLYGDESRAKL
jgi:acyl-CoA synthetase (AMP-forming)/AMP-acid ligase II